MSDWYHAQQAARQRYDGLSQHAAEGYRRRMRSRRNKHSLFARIGSISGAVTGNLDVANPGTRSAQVAKAYWWVPAGFAVLVLLRSIIGG